MKLIRAILTLISGAIGVGYLAIPYAIYKFGTLWGIIGISLAGLLVTVVLLSFVDIIIYDKGNHQLPGYAKKYLGKSTGTILMLISVFSILGALLVYSIILGEILSKLFSNFNIHYSQTIFSLIIIIPLLGFLQFNVKNISKISQISIFFVISGMFFIFFYSISKINQIQITDLDFSYFPIILGVSIFSLNCTNVVPIIDELIGYERDKYRKSIIFSIFITTILYIVFGVILSISFGSKMENGLISVFEDSGNGISVFILIYLFVGLVSPFVLLANSIKEIFHYDYKISKNFVIEVLWFVLSILLLINIGSYESIISFVGSVSLGLQAIIIIIIWFKLKFKKSLLSKILSISSVLILILIIIVTIL